MVFSESLKKNADFRNVYANGRSYADRNIVLYVWKNQTAGNRLGISASKKIGNSVVRHRFTRLVREIYRLQEEMFNSGLDMVVVARGRAGEASFGELRQSFLSLAKKARIIKNDAPGEEQSSLSEMK